MSVLLGHGRARLMLHTLRASGIGRPLLLLHGLGEGSPHAAPPETRAWPGPIYALDFTGHGESSVPRGGGYSPEILMGDVDAALATIGPATLLGRGLGAYVALLMSGGRPRLVRGAVLADGPGLAGGDGRPTRESIEGGGNELAAPDPLAIAELATDVRPPEYALRFVRLAVEKSGLPQPLAVAVAARERPAWLAAVATEPGVTEADVETALALYAGGE